MARPKKYNIDGKEVEKLARYGNSNVDIADFFGCDESLIRKSYSEFLAKGRVVGKIRLRELQWKLAKQGSVAMAIWLGKQMLGQSESPMLPEDELVEGFELNEI